MTCHLLISTTEETILAERPITLDQVVL